MRYLAVILIIAILSGCGRHCLSVDGDYKGVDGKIEYCYEIEKSKKAGMPVLSDASGEQIFGFDKGLINGIWEKLTGKASGSPGEVGAKSIPSEMPILTPTDQLGKIIEIVNAPPPAKEGE